MLYVGFVSLHDRALVIDVSHSNTYTYIQCTYQNAMDKIL